MKSLPPSRSKTYRNWMGMKQRCHNPNCKDYPNYGARGIKVCKRWHKFENFFKDMGHAPKGLSIDRIDNNKGYSKNNCRWASVKEQQRNRRSNRYITYRGRTQLLVEWSKELGMSHQAIKYRLDISKWSISKTFKTPTIPRVEFKYKGKSKSLVDWAKEIGVKPHTLYVRIYVRKWTIERALTTPLRTLK